MLRNRNSFFQESSMSNFNFTPNNLNFPNFSQPINASLASQSYYSGANMPNNLDDIEGRLAKLERQINRLDARISKLENSSKLESIDISSNMYMV